ncbi:unnamed protein product [Auanema sp. JU1783]|nr:unnamed protein product [Auanema sp. JU1783]
MNIDDLSDQTTMFLLTLIPLILGIFSSFVCIVEKKRRRRRRRRHSYSMPIPRPTTSSCSRERSMEYRVSNGHRRMSFVPPDDNKTVDECTSNWVGPIKI